MDVTTLYADLAKSKALWSHHRLDDPQSELLAKAGAAAADRMVSTPSRDLFEILLKLTELQEITAPDHLPAQAKLLASIIDDVHRKLVPPDGQAPKSKSAPSTYRAVKVDRRARPVVVDGKVYPSITAAAQATGISYSELRLRSH